MKTENSQYKCQLCGNMLNADDQNTNCPACRDMLLNKRGSGRDEGQSHIQYGPCSRCGSQTEYFHLPEGGHTTLCPECARAYSSSSY